MYIAILQQETISSQCRGMAAPRIGAELRDIAANHVAMSHETNYVHMTKDALSPEHSRTSSHTRVELEKFYRMFFYTTAGAVMLFSAHVGYIDVLSLYVFPPFNGSSLVCFLVALCSLSAAFPANAVLRGTHTTNAYSTVSRRSSAQSLVQSRCH